MDWQFKSTSGFILLYFFFLRIVYFCLLNSCSLQYFISASKVKKVWDLKQL